MNNEILINSALIILYDDFRMIGGTNIGISSGVKIKEKANSLFIISVSMVARVCGFQLLTNDCRQYAFHASSNSREYGTGWRDSPPGLHQQVHQGQIASLNAKLRREQLGTVCRSA